MLSGSRIKKRQVPFHRQANVCTLRPAAMTGKPSGWCWEYVNGIIQNQSPKITYSSYMNVTWNGMFKTGRSIDTQSRLVTASLGAQWQTVCLPVQETWAWPLGQQDPLEEETATHSSVLAWRIPRTEKPGGLQSMGSLKSQTWLINSTPPQRAGAGGRKEAGEWQLMGARFDSMVMKMF